MIEVMRLNGTTYWVNPHLIECIEQNPDVTLVMLSGKKLVVKNPPEDIISKITAYRRGLNSFQHIVAETAVGISKKQEE